ncbi:hypothetical protein KR044_004927, partial [Drosophila immigrans]
ANMAEVCRICMEESDTHVDIFEEKTLQASEPSLVQMLNECLTHKIHKDDPLPQKICSSCICDCQNAFRFRRICEESYQLFMELLAEEITDEQTSQSTETEIDLGCVKIENLDEYGKVESMWMAEDKLQPAEEEKYPVFYDDVKVENTVIAEPAEDNDISLQSARVTDDPLEPKSTGARSKANQTLDSHQMPKCSAYYYCHLCQKRYVHPHKLNQHLRGHQESMQAFRCRYCEQKFEKRSHLNAHVKVHLSDGKLFACRHCTKKFDDKMELDAHVWFHSDKRRPFACPHCPRKFLAKRELNTHVRFHLSRRKSCICPHCPRKFAGKLDLNDHISWCHKKEMRSQEVKKRNVK